MELQNSGRWLSWIGNMPSLPSAGEGHRVRNNRQLGAGTFTNRRQDLNSGKQKVAVQDRREILSLMWVFVMLNMLFADVFSFMYPGFLGELMTGYAGEVQVTGEFLLLAAGVTEIPIAMVLLSRVLGYRANRLSNIGAGVVTAVYVVGGGSPTLHYMFFAAMEVACLVFVVWLAWKWPSPEEVAVSIPNRRL